MFIQIRLEETIRIIYGGELCEENVSKIDRSKSHVREASDGRISVKCSRIHD